MKISSLAQESCIENSMDVDEIMFRRFQIGDAIQVFLNKKKIFVSSGSDCTSLFLLPIEILPTNYRDVLRTVCGIVARSLRSIRNLLSADVSLCFCFRMCSCSDNSYVQVQDSRVLVDFGSSGGEVWFPESSWRSSLINRTIHLEGLPSG